MKMLVAVVFVAALAACSKEEPAGSSQGNPILGTWEQTVDLEGTRVTVRLTFRTNGTFEWVVESSFGSSTITGTYQVDGDSLRLDATQGTSVFGGDEIAMTEEEVDESDQNATYAIEGDTLFITDTEDGESLELRRI